MTRPIVPFGAVLAVAALAATSTAFADPTAEAHPNIHPVGREGFASEAELQSTVGNRRYEFECPVNRSPDQLDNAAALERGVRVYVTNANNGYRTGRVMSGLLRDAIKAVWQTCPMRSTDSLGARTRYEIGYVDVFEPDPVTAQPLHDLHGEQFVVRDGTLYFVQLVDVGAQRIIAARDKETVAERQRNEALRLEHERTQQAAQQAASAERERLRAAAQVEAQRAAVIRAEAGARWWGGFWTLIVLSGLGWLLIKFHQQILRTIFLLAPTPADFDYDAALAQSRHLKGPAILVRARMYAQKIKLDAWKERMVAEREALSHAAARDAEFDRVRDERERAQVHRKPENIKKVVKAEQLVVDDRVAAIKHRPVMNDAERKRQVAIAKMNAKKAEDAFARVEKPDEERGGDSKAAQYEKRNKDLQANFDLRKKHIDDDHRLTDEERAEEHSKLKFWYNDQQQRLREGFNHP